MCAFYSSYLQQKAPGKHVPHILGQTSIIRRLKKLESTILYFWPTDKSEYHLSALVLANDSQVDDAEQIGVVIELLVGPIEKGSIYQASSWLSLKKRSARLAVFPPQECLLLRKVLMMVRQSATRIVNCLALKSSFALALTRKICSAFYQLRNFQLMSQSVDMWVPFDMSFKRMLSTKSHGLLAPQIWQTPLTKKDSFRAEILQPTLFTGRQTVHFASVDETQTSERSCSWKESDVNAVTTVDINVLVVLIVFETL